MSGMLQTLLAFVGIVLVLALAAQSIQEVIKTMFTLKGSAQLKAIEGLITEAVRYRGQYSIDAKAIMAEIERRLNALGQNAWRKGKVRLDEIGADSLKDLIETVPASALPGLPVGEAEAKAALGAIAAQAHKWFDLAVRPVDARYRRRMRVLALASSALIVIPMNAGADRMFGLARHDPAFRAMVDSMVIALEEIPEAATTPDTAMRAIAPEPADSAPANSAGAALGTAAATPDTAAAALRNARAAAALEMLRADRAAYFKPPTRADFGRPSWWAGIILSVLLVSMGAPFWHDVLESIFGFKNRIRAEAQQAKEVRSLVDEGAPIHKSA